MALSYPWRHAIRTTATVCIAIQMTPFFFPALFNLRLSRQLRAGLCGGFRLDLPWAVIRRVPAEHRDLFTTARHM